MLIRATVCATMLVLSACSSVDMGRQQSVGQNDLRSSVVKAGAEWAVDVDMAGTPYIAHYDDQRHIYLLSGKDTIGRKAAYDGADNRASSGLAVAALRDRAVFGYRDKMPNRDFFISKFDEDHSSTGMGKESIPLANFVLRRRSDSVVNALWVGEATVSSGANNQIYFSKYSVDAQQPLQKAIELFPGIYPVMAQGQDGKIVAFSWVKGAAVSDKGKIVVRRELDDGAFSPEKDVAEVGELTPIFNAIRSGNETIAYWHHRPEYLKVDYKLEGVVYSASGEWTPFSISSLDGYDFETVNMAADGAGNVAVVASVIKPDEKSKSRFKLMLVKSHDGGKTWGEAQELRKDSILQTQNYANAKAPHVAFIENSQLLIVWQDYRTLRSGIRYSYSEDAGRSWQVEDAWLLGGGKDNLALPVDQKAIYPQNDGVFVALEEMQSDALDKKRIYVTRVGMNRLKKVVDNTEISKPNYDRLTERAAEYWVAMRSKNAEKLYAMIDPYFRARVPFKAYSESLNTVEYGPATIEHTQHIGPVGLVVSKMSVELRPTLMNGKEVKVERAEVNIPTRWMWIDGDWYFEYMLESKSLRYATY